MLGRFAVTVDGTPLPADAFAQRRAAHLVQLLALARGHRLSRDVVVESLWPHLTAEAGVANLHKAAHHARRALGAPEAIVLRRGVVELAPGAEVMTDVERFERGDAAAYRGELLPEDPYASWVVDARERLREHRLALMRDDGRWEDVLREDPADEDAHRALMRRHAADGDRTAAARQFQRLSDELTRLGMEPADATLEVRREVLRGSAVRAPRHLHDPLVGRERELDIASAALRRAAGGEGGALLVSGPFGLGKTRLIEAVLAEAEALGLHGLRGAAHEEEGHAPYAPVIEALDLLVRERPELLAALPDAAQATLSRLLPSTVAAEARADRHRVFHSVAQLLNEAAADRGVLLAIDDLQAADEATAALLHYLARGARGVRLLVVAGLRDEPITGAAAAVRSSLLERGAAVEIALRPLDRAAITTIAQHAARRPLSPSALRAIERSATGNPFLAEELAASVDASGEISVPPRLRAVVGRRLAALAPIDERLRAALAVLDDGFTSQDVAALAGPNGVDEALERAVAGGILDHAGDRYRYRHALTREELAARLPEAALREAHLAAAARLAADDAAPEAAAHHLVRAGHGREAVPLLTRAAEWAADVGAFRDGTEWAEIALEHASSDQRPDLLALRARLLLGAGDTRAPAAYAAAVAAGVPGLRLQHARACLAAGDIAGANAAIEAAGAVPQEQIAELLLLRGMVAWHSGDWETARRLAAEADRLAPDPADLVGLKGLVAHLDGGWEAHSRRQLTEVWDTPDLAGRVYDTYLCVTEYVLTAGDPYDGVARFAKRLRAQAHEAGARRGEAFAATVLGETELLTGDLQAARAHLADAARLSREAGASSGESLARARLGEALLHLGDRAGARAQLEHALELAHISTIPQHMLFHVYAVLVQVPDDPAEALALIDRGELLFEQRWLCGFCPTGYHVAASRVCARAGALERGHQFLTRAQKGAAHWLAGPWPAALAEARGELLLAEDLPDDARNALRRASDGYAAAGQLLYERRARETLGRL